MSLSLSAAFFALGLARGDQLGIGSDHPIDFGARSVAQQIQDFVMICLALTFLGVPLVWVLVDGTSSLSDLPLKVWTAAVRSIFIALGATLICLLLAFSLLDPKGEMLATLGIAISLMVLGTGLFLIVRPFFNPSDISLIVTLCVNALMSLPFAV